MNENNIFEGIPSLGDTQGTQDYVAQMNQPAQQEPQIPPMLQPVEDNTPQENPAPQGYTQDQINQLIEQNRQLQAQMAQFQAQQNQFAQQRVQPQPAQQSQSTYTPQQQAIIMELVKRGVPMERIQASLRQGAQNDALMNRLNSVENYLKEQAYAQARDAFVDKMTTFGDKFGLSEEDLVQFADTALQNFGVNLADAKDVEAVFRMVYPDQYAIRMQRINGMGSSRIYGGANVTETPSMVSDKAMDAYVDAFLKGAMPNQYRQK